MLAAGGDAFGLHPFDQGDSHFGYELRRTAEGAVGNHGVGRVRVHVQDGSEVHVDVRRAQLAGEEAGDLSGEVWTARGADRAHRGNLRERRAEADDAAALLIGADEERAAGEGLQLRAQVGQLLGEGVVALEKNRATDAAGDQV